MVELNYSADYGGFYHPDKELFGIPILIFLYSDPDHLERIVQHEMIHGVFEVGDEGITEGLSAEILGSVDSGVYREQVDMYNTYFGDLDAQDVISLLSTNPEVQIIDLMSKMLEKDFQMIDPTEMNPEFIKDSLQNYWHIITRLFPRLVSTTMGEVSNSFEQTDISFERFWAEHQFAITTRIPALNYEV